MLSWWVEDQDNYFLGAEVVEAYIRAFGVTDHSARWYREHAEEISDAYLGSFDSFKEFVQESCYQLGRVVGSDEWIEPWATAFSYIDWDSLAHNWERSGDYVWHETDSGTVVVFRTSENSFQNTRLVRQKERK